MKKLLFVILSLMLTSNYIPLQAMIDDTKEDLVPWEDLEKKINLYFSQIYKKIQNFPAGQITENIIINSFGIIFININIDGTSIRLAGREDFAGGLVGESSYNNDQKLMPRKDYELLKKALKIIAQQIRTIDDAPLEKKGSAPTKSDTSR